MSDAQASAPVRLTESPRDRFLRLAHRRVSAVAEKMEAVGNLSRRPDYDYSPEDVEKIRAFLIDELDMTLARFRARRRPTFEL